MSREWGYTDTLSRCRIVTSKVYCGSRDAMNSVSNETVKNILRLPAGKGVLLRCEAIENFYNAPFLSSESTARYKDFRSAVIGVVCEEYKTWVCSTELNYPKSSVQLRLLQFPECVIPHAAGSRLTGINVTSLDLTVAFFNISDFRQ